jgi:hypothetical protein
MFDWNKDLASTVLELLRLRNQRLIRFEAESIMAQEAMSPRDLYRLTSAACRIAARHDCDVVQAIDMIESESNDGSTGGTQSLARFAGEFKRIRDMRGELFGAHLFREPAWEMMLDLYIAEHEMKHVSISSLCIASGVASTTALRHIDKLMESGMLMREGDASDHRRTHIRLAEGVSAKMSSVIEAMQRSARTTDGVQRFSPAGPREA